MNHKKLFIRIFSFLILFISLFAISARAQAAVDVTGWAWSSNIGWISFNCSNGDATHTTPAGTCAVANYKVTFATSSPTVGTFSGYAWSPNIGWISFNETIGCPSGTCKPTVNLSTGNVTGWVRACAGSLNGDCAGGDRTDGDAGWGSLSGVNYESPTPDGTLGVTFKPATGAFVGYSWGGVNIGWLKFNAAGPVGGEDVVCPDCVTSGNSRLTLTANGLDSVTIRANASNEVTVIVGWDLNNVNQVKLPLNSNWPGGNENDAEYVDVTGIHHPFSVSGQTSVKFTNVLATTTKTLKLKYYNIAESSSDVADVDITLEPYRPITTTSNCSAPTNARLCDFSATNISSQTILLDGGVGSCQSTESQPIRCEYYCPTGFTKSGNICKRPGTIEEI